MDELNFNDSSLDALLDTEQLGGMQDAFMTAAATTAQQLGHHQLQQLQQTQPQQQQQQQQQQQIVYRQIQPVTSIPSQGLLTSNGSANAAAPAPNTYVQYSVPTTSLQQQQQPQAHQQSLPVATTVQQIAPQSQLPIQPSSAMSVGYGYTGLPATGVPALAPAGIVSPSAMAANMASTVSLSSRTARDSSSVSSSRTGTSRRERPSKTQGSQSIVSDSTTSFSRKRSSASLTSSLHEGEGTGDNDRRRQDRNVREQKRAHKITQQIAQLRDVLESANIQFKSDKFSTLVTVAEYIKQLQAKSAALDLEHKQLLETISKTNSVVNQTYLPGTSSSNDDTQSTSDSAITASASPLAEAADELLAVSGIDYKSIFTQCTVPLAIASVDGRFLDCNQAFERLTGIQRSQIQPLHHPTGATGAFPDGIASTKPDNATVVSGSVASTQQQQTSNDTTTATTEGQSSSSFSLFSLLCREDMEQVFMAMSDILQRPGSNEMSSSAQQQQHQHSHFNSSTISQNDFWSGIIRLNTNPNQKLRLNAALVRSPQGRAKFFDYALTPIEDVTIAMQQQP